MKAMILAAGKGTRLRPLTDSKPKVLMEICGLTMLEHQINYVRSFGVEEIIINVHHLAEQVEDFIRHKHFGCRIEISDERDQLLDTGGGLKKTAWFFDDGEPFFLLGSDMYTDLDLSSMLSYHRKHNPLATLAVKKRNSTRDFIVDEDNLLCGWKNNLTGEEVITRTSTTTLSYYGFSVIHVISPAIFDLISEKGVFSMTALYLRLSSQYPVKAFIQNQSQWYEFGRIENLHDAQMISVVSSIIDKYRPGRKK